MIRINLDGRSLAGRRLVYLAKRAERDHWGEYGADAIAAVKVWFRPIFQAAARAGNIKRGAKK